MILLIQTPKNNLDIYNMRFITKFLRVVRQPFRLMDNILSYLIRL